MKITGLRKANDNYFSFANWDGRQVTPFIIVRRNEIIAVESLESLLMNGKDNDTILHAWPGEWRTDIISYKLKKFKDWLK